MNGYIRLRSRHTKGLSLGFWLSWTVLRWFAIIIQSAWKFGRSFPNIVVLNDVSRENNTSCRAKPRVLCTDTIALYKPCHLCCSSSLGTHFTICFDFVDNTIHLKIRAIPPKKCYCDHEGNKSALSTRRRLQIMKRNEIPNRGEKFRVEEFTLNMVTIYVYESCENYRYI